MAFEPDIIVTEPDTSFVKLVAEVKLHIANLEQAQEQLKAYMFGMRCSVGMLITPDKLLLYRDTYKAYDASAIEKVGEYSMKGVFRVGQWDQAQQDLPQYSQLEIHFEEEVQSWLEQTARGVEIVKLPEELREAIHRHVLPVLADGDVRAAGPRAPQSESVA